MNELNKLYVAMLEAWNARVQDDYSLVMMIDNEKFPIKVDGMKVYLPVDAVLDGRISDKVFFHPACESIISRETEIFKVIRKLTSMRLLDMFMRYPHVLFAVAGKRSTKSMRKDVMEIIEPLQELKAGEQKEIHDLFKKMTVEIGDSNIDNRFIHFQITKGGRSRNSGEKIYYKTKPQFPFYSEMARKLNRSEDTPRNQKVEINGVNISLKALAAAVHIFRMVFPSIDTPEQYEGDSVMSDAARLVSFCSSYVLVAEDMNMLQNLFRSDFDKVGVYGLDTSFTEPLEHISDIYRQVPVLNYNNQSSSSEDNRSNMDLINSVITTNSHSMHHSQSQQHSGNDNAGTGSQTDGFKSVVLASMQPGEMYQGWTWDTFNNCFNHSVMSVSGPVMYKVTRSGNILAREFAAASMPMYQNYGNYQQHMQQQHPQYMQQQQQPAPVYGQVPAQQPSVQSNTPSGMVTF